MKTTHTCIHTHTDKKDMKRTHTNWSDNSKHSLLLIIRKKLQIVVSFGELFRFVACSTMISIFCWSDPDFSFQLSGRSVYILTEVGVVSDLILVDPMSVQSVMGVLWPLLARKCQHTLGRAEKSVKFRVWPGRNKTYFYHALSVKMRFIMPWSFLHEGTLQFVTLWSF